jgi:hypothetical protein
MNSPADQGKTLCRSFTALPLSPFRRQAGEAESGSPGPAQFRSWPASPTGALVGPLLMQQRASPPSGVASSGRARRATALAVTDGEADRNIPTLGQGALHVIAAQAKQTVVIPVGWSQPVSMAVPGQPVTNVQHPRSRPGDAQQQDLQAVGIINLAVFQVKAVALPVPKGRLNPEALAATAPGLGIRRQVERPIARAVLIRRPVGDQVKRTKAVLLGQVDLVQVAPLPGLQAQRCQGLPRSTVITEIQVRLQANLPMPVVRLASVLEWHGPKLTIAVEMDAHLA